MNAVKPTHFGAWRLPTYEQRRLQYRCPTPAAELRSLQGWNADGSFAAAIAKEYPDALCHAIAHTFADRGQEVDTNFFAAPAVVDDLTFADMMAPFQIPITGDDDVGEDFVDTWPLPILCLPRFQ